MKNLTETDVIPNSRRGTCSLCGQRVAWRKPKGGIGGGIISQHNNPEGKKCLLSGKPVFDEFKPPKKKPVKKAEINWVKRKLFVSGFGNTNGNLTLWLEDNMHTVHEEIELELDEEEIDDIIEELEHCKEAFQEPEE